MAVILAHFDYRKTPDKDLGNKVFLLGEKCYATQGGRRSVDLWEVSKGEYEEMLAKGWAVGDATSWEAYFAALADFNAARGKKAKREAVECQTCCKMRWSDQMVHGMCSWCQEEAVTSG